MIDEPLDLALRRWASMRLSRRKVDATAFRNAIWVLSRAPLWQSRTPALRQDNQRNFAMRALHRDNTGGSDALPDIYITHDTAPKHDNRRREKPPANSGQN
jgi:hypothetical protein